MADAANAPGERPVKLAFNERARGILHRFVRDWIWPSRARVALALLYTAGLAATTGGYPLIIKHSFDTLMTPGSDVLPLVLTAIVIVTAARGLFLYLHQVTTQGIVLRLITNIQQTAFAHLVNADYARITRETTGQLVSRLTNDLTFIQQAAQTSLVAFVKDALSIIAIISVMLYLDWQMTLIIIVLCPIAILPIRNIGRRLRAVSRRTQVELGGVTSKLTENLSGARLIKAFRLEEYAAKRVNENFEHVFQLRMKAVRARARVGPVLEALAGLAVAGVIAFAFLRISGGSSTVGDFLGFVAALLLVAQSFKSLDNVSTVTMEGLAAADRIYELLDEKPTVVDRPAATSLAISTGTIELDSVNFAYRASAAAPAVRNFSLTVPGGKTAALVGRSGAGKSTIINLVARLFDVQSGSISIDGQDVRDVTLSSLRNSIAIVSQEVTLFDDTILANIGLGRLGSSTENIITAAKAAAAHEFIMAQPNGYDTVIGESGLRLSGGQRQRLALARAILKDAPILLLDEATSALDTESERLVQEALARFTRNRTTIVIAHRLSTVQRADLICFMKDGRVGEVGSHAELLARDGDYARLCRSQILLDLDTASFAPAEPTEAA